MRILTAATLLTLTLASTPIAAEPMKPGDRQRLLAHLEMTESWLTTEVEGLSDAQLKFRMTPDSWSITDVVEHLAVAEPQYWNQLLESLKAPAGTIKAEATDAGILWYGIDRTNRQRTGEARVPKGRYEKVDQSLAEFRKLRATMREKAKSTDEDLRGRLLKDGNMDVYQWYLMISTHSQRHILQIREIKAHAAYPKR
jgi:DinB superfamily